MHTIESKLEENRGFGPGFDFLRVGFAIGIVLLHANYLLSGDGGEYGLWWFSRFALLPMFFALSGFLVTGSAQRLNLRDFLINRFARILPALLTEILLSSLILGPIVTALSLNEYFTSPILYKYILNVVGYVHYALPGVFEENTIKGIVNVSLWTIPHEIACYALMSFAIYFGLSRTTSGLVRGILFIFLLLIGLNVLRQFISSDSARAITIATKSMTELIVYFVLGSLAFLVRKDIRYSLGAFIACCAAYIALTIFGNDSLRVDHALIFRAFTGPILIYIVLFIGVTKMPSLPVYNRGDYSYGIYLYGFPIQQTFIHFFPGVRNILAFDFISVVGATLFAVFSWHIIEKPALKLRKSFSVTLRNHPSPHPAKRLDELLP